MNSSLYVGERPEDETAAQRADIRFYPAADWRQQHRLTPTATKSSGITPCKFGFPPTKAISVCYIS